MYPLFPYRDSKYRYYGSACTHIRLYVPIIPIIYIAIYEPRHSGTRGYTVLKVGLVMRESRIENRLVREVEKRGGKAPKFVSPGWSGAQDRLVLMPEGRIWFVELKRPGGKPRPLQTKRQKELEDLGFRVRVISTAGELEAFLKEVVPT